MKRLLLFAFLCSLAAVAQTKMGPITVQGNIQATTGIKGPLTNTAQAGSNFAFIGDSITVGVRVTTGKDWPSQSMLGNWFAGQGTKYNLGVSGNTCAQVLARYTTDAHPLSPAVTGKTGYFFVFCGVNDISTGSTVSTVYANLLSIYQAAHTDGWKVVGVTLMPDTVDFDISKEDNRQWYNRLIRYSACSPSDTSLTGCWDYMLDFAQVLADDTDCNFFIDYPSAPGYVGPPWPCSLHPNESGYRVLAAYTNGVMRTGVAPASPQIQDQYATHRFGAIGINGLPAHVWEKLRINGDINPIDVEGVTGTDLVYAQFKNSLGLAVFGIEGSIPGTLATGSTAYAAVVGNGIGELNLSAGGIVRSKIDPGTGLHTFLNGIKVGTSGATISDTRKLIQATYGCGSTATCANTTNNSDWTVYGTVALTSATPSTATITGISPAFTSTSTYFCTAVPEGNTAVIAAAGVAVTKVSGSSITLTGPNTVTTVIDYICIGH